MRGTPHHLDEDLVPCGIISGIVTDSVTLQPIQAAYVEAYNLAESSMGNCYTDENGHYEIAGLATGTYKLQLTG